MSSPYSSAASKDTPLPVPRRGTEGGGLLSAADVEALQTALTELFEQHHMSLDPKAAELLIQKSVINGRLIGSILDDFFHAVRNANLSTINVKLTLKFLNKQENRVQVKILNCFQDICQYRWDVQNQKYIQTDKNKRCLIPDTAAYHATSLHRYHKAVNKLKACPNVVWWSEIPMLHQMALTSGDRIVVQPAQCAKGLKGSISVFGVLRLLPDESLISQTWVLEDASQHYTLDFSLWKPDGQLYLDSNMVVISGVIDNELNVLHVKDVSHPPFNDEFDFEESDPLKDQECRKEQRNLLKQQIGKCSLTKHQWLVFGVCHLDNNNVISNIYAALNQHDVSHLAGIVLTGEFSSKPFNIHSKEDYIKGFGELFDALKLWHDQFDPCQVTPFKVVLVPGKEDSGPRYLPKFPLLEVMITAPFSEILSSFKESIDVVLASNPMWLEISYPSTSTQQEKYAVICRTDLIRHIDVFHSSLGAPFKQPLSPTSEELVLAIPPLIVGQSHLYPTPFKSTHILHTAIGYDYMLELFLLPYIVILSDVTVAYATYWQERCWFCSPGQIIEKSYLVLDLLDRNVQIREVKI